MVHSDGIQNDLELQWKKRKKKTLNGAFWRYSKRFRTVVGKQKKQDTKWCILTVFETIWNCSGEKRKKKTLNGAFWQYSKRFGTVVGKKKTRTLNGVFLRHLIRYGSSEIILKTWTLNGAFWRYSKRFRTAVISVTHSETIFEPAMRRNSTFFDLFKEACSRPRTRNPCCFLKIGTVIGALGCYLTWYFGNPRRIRAINGAFCRSLIQCFDL